MKISELAVAYDIPYFQGLKSRIKASFDIIIGEEQLQQCLVLLHVDGYNFYISPFSCYRNIR